MKASPVVWLLVAACGAAPPAPDQGRRQLVPLRITFEPPLAAPGLLQVHDESGGERRLPTRCSGVDLEILPGPVLLQLSVEGQQHSLAARIASGCTLTWHLGASR
ncbi:MAG: hypothetical protein JNN13_06760 [Planctomycetes bacterium]|nr:hypothetical protein [Planctomycetota bacterium]